VKSSIWFLFNINSFLFCEIIILFLNLFKVGPVPWKADNTTTACDFSDGFQVIKQIPNSQSKDCPNLCKSTDNCSHYVWYFKEIDSKNIALGVCSLIWGTPLKALYSADLKNIGAVTPKFLQFFDKCGIISK
jgi:hypothetical protein